jgi:hypothetical protein
MLVNHIHSPKNGSRAKFSNVVCIKYESDNGDIQHNIGIKIEILTLPLPLRC